MAKKEEEMSAIFGIIAILIFYFLPAIMAYSNKKKNAQAITVLNVFLGWIIIGWIVALIWACMKD
jgi:predicted membrane channel-forming protein YqfA (hemolysin III family)